MADAKAEYNATAESIKGFESAQESLKGLVKGTQEWRDALAESNENAKDLIKRFGSDLKAGDYSFSADGQIQFKEGVLENL
jgi:hypothetical protein